MPPRASGTRAAKGLTNSAASVPPPRTAPSVFASYAEGPIRLPGAFPAATGRAAQPQGTPSHADILAAPSVPQRAAAQNNSNTGKPIKETGTHHDVCCCVLFATLGRNLFQGPKVCVCLRGALRGQRSPCCLNIPKTRLLQSGLAWPYPTYFFFVSF